MNVGPLATCRERRLSHAPNQSCLSWPSPHPPSRPQDDAGRFTEWATTAFNEKKEVVVLRPDLVIFGVYTHKEAFNIVPDLEDMLWFS